MDSRDPPARPSPEGPRSVCHPLQPLANEADAGAVAAAVLQAWAQADAALNPVIGPRGVLALYNRSLSLAAARHPWLAAEHAGALAPQDLPALRAALAGQPATVALQGGQALLQAFDDLLCSLIGASLTERLLGSAWGPAPVPAPAPATAAAAAVAGKPQSAAAQDKAP
jgi:hypothetical protein